MGPFFGTVQAQARGIGTKRIGQENIAAGINRAAVQFADFRWFVRIPHLWRIARHKTHVEQVCACGTVGQ